jgi:hypothetical protein
VNKAQIEFRFKLAVEIIGRNQFVER